MCVGVSKHAQGLELWQNGAAHPTDVLCQCSIVAGPKIDTARHRRPEWTLVLLMVSEKSLPAVPGFVVASLAPGRSFLHPFTLVLLFGHHSSKDRKKDS